MHALLVSLVQNEFPIRIRGSCAQPLDETSNSEYLMSACRAYGPKDQSIYMHMHELYAELRMQIQKSQRGFTNWSLSHLLSS